jgi:hypothetical protein
MTAHQCPKCELRFTYATVLDHHCRTDHPDFHHDYPVRGERHWGVEPAAPVAPAEPPEAPTG